MDGEGVSMYPNPTSDFLNIELDKTAGNTIIVTDGSGKVQFTREVSTLTQYQLDVSKYAKGVYLLTITNTNGKQSAKFVVK